MFTLIKNIYKYIQSYYYPKRKTISPTLRKNVWAKINGSKTTGKCYCCDDPLQFKNMHVAHVIPHALGGTIALSNLYPTCMHCNLKCGKINLHTYKRNLKK